MEPNIRELRKIGTWLAGDHVGMSSKYMAAVFIGGKPERVSYPFDPSDFNRCMKFLECLDKSKRMVFIMGLGMRSKQWSIISDNWYKLERLYREECKTGWDRAPKLYEKMKEIGL